MKMATMMTCPTLPTKGFFFFSFSHHKFYLLFKLRDDNRLHLFLTLPRCAMRDDTLHSQNMFLTRCHGRDVRQHAAFTTHL